MKSREVIEFSVTDTGIGIPQEKQQLIFEAFQQVDGSPAAATAVQDWGCRSARCWSPCLGGEMRLVSEQGKGQHLLRLPAIQVESIVVKTDTDQPEEEKDHPGTGADQRVAGQ